MKHDCGCVDPEFDIVVVDGKQHPRLTVEGESCDEHYVRPEDAWDDRPVIELFKRD